MHATTLPHTLSLTPQDPSPSNSDHALSKTTIPAGILSTVDGSNPAQCKESLPPSLTFRRTLLIVIALVTNLFLATTDATIVATSLPTIASELQAPDSQYAWVGIAYLLMQTTCQPLYGQLSDAFGRKAVLFCTIAVFILGSALCGSAQSMTCLIVARGVSGVGGGGIVNCVWVIITEIVPPTDKAKWSQALSVTWSLSAIAGPVLGGLFSSVAIPGLTWRWAFYINIPIGIAALVALAYSLQFIPVGSGDESANFRQLVRNFDYVGLILLMGGTTCLVLGLSTASSVSWQSPVALGLISGGLAGLAGGCVYEARKYENCLLPPDIFTKPAPILILVIAILHNFAFTAGTFYLPVFYQAVHGSTPLEAGMRVLPYSLGSALASIPTSWFISCNDDPLWKSRRLLFAITFGIAISALGFGLMITLNELSSLYLQEIYPLISGIGIGMLFQTPFQVITDSLPDNIASATSVFFLVRFIGTTTGLSVAAAIFDSQVRISLPATYAREINGVTLPLRTLSTIEPLQLRTDVLSAVSSSISKVWVACTPCLAFAFILSIILWIALEKHIAHDTSFHESSTADLEKGSHSPHSSQPRRDITL